MKKTALALVLAVTLLIVSVVAGTMAWLTAKSDVVVNTFTSSNISVTLKETTGNEYQMVPGYTITKDPKATVLKDSVDCWLFVKLEKSANFDTYLEYTVADGWTKLEGVTDTVYYRKVPTANSNTTFDVLEDNKVTVKSSLTKEDMEKAEFNQPTLTITAYASQLNSGNGEFTAAEAWANISNK